jgi:cysteine desulfurase
MSQIYLDYAAATPLDYRVMEAMKPYFSDIFYNPSALYSGALEAKLALDDARQKTASLIGAKPSEVIFTAGGTESANLAINGVMQNHKDGNIVISSIEHDAVLKPSRKYRHKELKVNKKGRVDPKDISLVCDDDTVLISVMLANNEIGTIQPIKDISKEVIKLRQSRKTNGNKKPLYLHVDACQAPLYIDVSVSRLGVDMLTLNGGKIYGPKQSGILYLRTGTIISPEILGGGQEFGYRSGTENVPFAIGFSKALELAYKGQASRTKEMTKIRDYFINELENKHNAKITGDKKHRLANNIHSVFENTDNERVLFALDNKGIFAATGSACSASNDEASHVLLAIGKSEEDARSSLRFSLGKESTVKQVDKVIAELGQALKS